MSRICAIGANVYDTLILLPEYPREDTKLAADSIRVSGGGPAATGLVAAAKLGETVGVVTEFIGSIADDERGKFLYEDFRRRGVGTYNITVEANCESFCSFVLLSADKKTRTCVFHRGTKLPLVLNGSQLDALKSADILMVDGNELDAAICGAAAIHSVGGKVLYDAGGLYKGIERLLPEVDILIPSEEFALGFTGCDNADDAAKRLYEQFFARSRRDNAGKPRRYSIFGRRSQKLSDNRHYSRRLERRGRRVPRSVRVRADTGVRLLQMRAVRERDLVAEMHVCRSARRGAHA